MPPRGQARSRLPAELSSFVGRRRELAETRRLLDGHRLVTLAGPGGVGKTRLGLRVAGRVRRAFPDGVFLTDLSRLENHLLLGDTVLQTLGVDDHSARPAVEVLSEFLAGRRLLLVLDNCEHLIDACRLLVLALVRVAAELSVLATSREPLRVAGEAVLDVPPITTVDALELFEQRGQAVLSGFAVTVDNRDTVAELCRRLDDLPLAIELAAAGLPALSPPQILERLDGRFGLLGRHETLRAAVECSAQSCSIRKRALWARASVFAVDFTLEAAETVCSGGEVPPEEIMDTLAGLVGKSILAVRHEGAAVRYVWLDTLRAYGLGLLAGRGEEAELRRRHLDWCLALTRPLWMGDGDPRAFGQVMVRLAAERANLRAALEYGLTEPGQARAGLDLAGLLSFFWLATGTLSEGRYWLERALDADREPSPQRARALWACGWIAIEQGEPAAAGLLLAEARELAARLADEPAAAWTTVLNGYAALYEGALERARPLLEDGLARQRLLGHLLGESAAIWVLAQTTSYLGDPVSERISEQYLALADRHDWTMARAIALRTLGLELVRQSRAPRATAVLIEALHTGEGIDYHRGRAYCFDLLAWAAEAGGQHERAARLFGTAGSAYQRIGTTVPRPQRDCADRYAAAARQALGEAAFAAAYRGGAEMSEEQAVGYALGETRAAATSPSATVAPVLTGREQQIALLVADGLSNKAIAAELVISVRTAESHLDHIMVKLGLTGRAQIAAWAARHL